MYAKVLSAIVAVLALAFALQGCSTTPAGYRDIAQQDDSRLPILSGEELARLLEGRTICYEANDNGRPMGCETYFPDHRTWFVDPNGTGMRGRWEEKGAYRTCFRYEGDPTEHCFIYACDDNGHLGAVEWPWLLTPLRFRTYHIQAAFEGARNVQCPMN